MPLTTWTITTAVLHLTCDDCGATLEAMNMDTLALMVKALDWKTDVPVDRSMPDTVIAECPKCTAAK